jgi:hypothetical protein
MFGNQEKPKINFNKSMVNAWASFLFCIWKDDVDTIHKKLLIKAQDTFIWSNEVEDYITETVLKI